VSLLDDLSRGVRSVTDSLSLEASKHSLRSQIADEEQAVWRVYAQMGHRALELLSAGAIQDPALADLAAQVPPHQERIEELKRQVEELDRSLRGPPPSPPGKPPG
jgi:hypothetical protein